MVKEDMLSGQTVLIVEAEFLIAFDIQAMLEDLSAGQLLLARSAAEANRFKPDWPSIDLAIIECVRNCVQTDELLTGLLQSGTPVVLNSSDSALIDGHPDFPDIPVIIKPMIEEDFRRSVAQAIARLPRTSDCVS
jgi:hypothetical protein